MFTIVSLFIYSFALPILFKGRKTSLEPSDLYEVLDEHKADKLGENLFVAWQADAKVPGRKADDKNGILRVILKVFGWELIVSGIVIGILELGLR